ncbi:4-hydroxythreonine-4-phosphate dehydrogenase PdxA [Haloferula sargassicola]|uniref:D-threonate 4-phosphate dehydrogenase n=1 Tax=Haloferula sargassicola TaxID=490096 RepID=A0ABP9US16_9BACT
MPGRRILITLGDPAGIGPEVIRAALASPELPGGFEFEVVGDPSRGVPGRPDEASAAESLRALEEAGDRWARDPTVAAVVTGPVSKFQLERVGFRHPGQTEFFAEKSATKNFAMCLSGDRLTVGLVTIHIPYASVAAALTQEEIVRVGRLLAGFSRLRTSRAPIIGVAGLNPHAGENGKFGREEIDLIGPAIETLNATGEGTFLGPGVPDAIFREAVHGRFDAVLAMYHDQGLIPLKLVDFDSAVNVTLGLPKPRTSPDHGTAFDIAGKGIASHHSMLAAIRLAAQLGR